MGMVEQVLERFRASEFLGIRKQAVRAIYEAGDGSRRAVETAFGDGRRILQGGDHS